MKSLPPLLSKPASFFKGVLVFARAHKIAAGLVVLVLGVLGYWGYGAWTAAHTPAQYTLSPASTGSISETITGSGQVTSSHTLTLSPKSNGTVTAVKVVPGQKVSSGTVIAYIDATDAQKNLRDAKLALESAELSYKKAHGTQSSIATALNTAESVLADTRNALDVLDDVLNGFSYTSYPLRSNVTVLEQLQKDATSEEILAPYYSAQDALTAAEKLYDTTPRSAGVSETGATMNAVLTATQNSSQAIKEVLAVLRSARDHTDTVSPEYTAITNQIATLATSATTMNSDTVQVRTTRDNLSDSNVSDSESRIALEKARNTYQDALDTLEDYVVRAPFSGTIATVDVQAHDEAGTATKVATLITDTEYAELSLSETDAALVSVGQKAELTFDAIEDLSIEGSVIQVDPAGTVQSGVVSYTAKIGIEKKDARIKPGMTVNATIITASKENAIIVPSSAVKIQGGRSYVEIARGGEAALPTLDTASSSARTGTTRIPRTKTVSAHEVTLERVFVETGIESDTMTEIVSGVHAGDAVVTQTVNANGKTATQSGSIFGLFGGNRSSTSGSARTAPTPSAAGASATMPARPAGAPRN